MVERTSLLLIAGYVGVLGLAIYELNHTPSEVPPATDQAARSLPPLDLPPAVITSIAAYDAITERPLFDPTRRPPAEDKGQTGEPVKPTEQPTKINGLRLTAVIKDTDSTTVLLEDQSGKTSALHQGDQLGGWRIDEILDDRVVMVSGSGRKTLMVHQFDPVVRAKKVRRPLRRLKQRPARLPTEKPDPAAREAPNSPRKP